MCRKCGKVKTERLDWLADNPFYTKRFYRHVGRKCRTMSIKDVAKELHLDWHAVKELDKRYMHEQLRRATPPAPSVIGIDEIAVGRRHAYRIVVSDLIRRRPIWFGGVDRSEASLDAFYASLGAKKAARVRLAVMDMWKAFEKSTRRNAPGASILYDKFHVISHLGEALDEVRKQEYARLAGRDRSFGGKQAAEHRLSAQGILWAALELSVRMLGPAVLRELEGLAQMATAKALREVRRHDREALGGHRLLLPSGKQGAAGFCRRVQQQDPLHPKTGLWPARRRVPAPENPHLHAPPALKPPTRIREEPYF